jgi:hypothetical protein
MDARSGFLTRQRKDSDMTTTTNPQRGRRAAKAIASYDADLAESNLIDLLADAMHLCDAQGIDFNKVLATAVLHYDAERAEGNEIPDAFDAYEIHGVRKFGKGKDRYCEQVPDDEAQFWSLYGHIRGQGLDCIGDFKTRQHAEEVYARITGQPYYTEARHG